MNYYKSFIEKFLFYVERDPVLWDAKNELYGNSNAENSGWEYISVQLNELYEGGHASGANLRNLWLSLLSLKQEYHRDKGGIGFGFVQKMNFLEVGKKKKVNDDALDNARSFAFGLHVFANVVPINNNNVNESFKNPSSSNTQKTYPSIAAHIRNLYIAFGYIHFKLKPKMKFLVLYIIMSLLDAFTGTFKNCRCATYPLFFFWCVVTGLSTATTYSTINKNLRIKHVLPTVMLALYTVISAATYFFSQPISKTRSYMDYNGYRKVETTLQECPTEQTRFSYEIIGFAGFPLSIALSFRYHFIEITLSSAYITSWKMICAAYYGSSVSFLFFMATIDWHGAYYLFFIWMLVNGKCTSIGVSYAWDAHKEVLKERYSVKWNSATDKFEMVLNGKEMSTKLSEIVVTPVKTETPATKIVS